jgi:hypothetical protein
MLMPTAEVALTCERANINGVQTTEADTDGSFEQIHGDPLRCGGKCFSTLALARPSVESRFVEAQARYMGPLSEWSIYRQRRGCCHASSDFTGQPIEGVGRSASSARLAYQPQDKMKHNTKRAPLEDFSVQLNTHYSSSQVYLATLVSLLRDKCYSRSSPSVPEEAAFSNISSGYIGLLE